MIQAIIFDLDDTLIDSQAAYARSMKAVGLDPGNRQYLQARQEVKARLPAQHPSARNRLIYFKRMMEKNSGLSARKLLVVMERYEKALERDLSRQWGELQRNRLFESLSARFELHILTNENTRTQMIKAAALDPRGKFFRSILTSEEVGYEKPHPEGFKYFLKSAGLVARRCVFVGDSEKNDLIPAQKLGMLAIHTHEFTHQPSKNFPTLAKLDWLPKLLEGM